MGSRLRSLEKEWGGGVGGRGSVNWEKKNGDTKGGGGRKEGGLVPAGPLERKRGEGRRGRYLFLLMGKGAKNRTAWENRARGKVTDLLLREAALSGGNGVPGIMCGEVGRRMGIFESVCRRGGGGAGGENFPNRGC